MLSLTQRSAAFALEVALVVEIPPEDLLAIAIEAHHLCAGQRCGASHVEEQAAAAVHLHDAAARLDEQHRHG